MNPKSPSPLEQIREKWFKDLMAKEKTEIEKGNDCLNNCSMNGCVDWARKRIVTLEKELKDKDNALNGWKGKCGELEKKLTVQTPRRLNGTAKPRVSPVIKKCETCGYVKAVNAELEREEVE